MLTIIFAILTALGIYLFLRNQHVISITILVFFLTNGLQLIPESLTQVKYFDFTLAYIIALCIILPFKRKGFFSLKENFSKLNILLFGYMTLEFVMTLVRETEYPDFAFKVYRQFFFIGLYFIIKTISAKDIQKICRNIFILTCVTLCIYLLQIVLGMQILTGTIDNIEFSGADTRFRNTPIFFDFALFYVFISPSLKKIRIPLITLFLAGLVAPLNRGPIIAFVAVFTIYLFLEGKLVSFVRYALLIVAIGFVLWPFMARRFSKENAGGDIQHAMQLRSYKNFAVSGGGNFEFRILLLEERWDYLRNHPQYLLTGIGMRHEDSPLTMNQFHFYLGALKKVNDKNVVQQIDTTDLAWATMILRYGLIGVCIYVIIFIYLLIKFFKSEKDSLGKIGALLIAMYLANSFATDILIRPSTFFILFLIYSFKTEKKLMVRLQFPKQDNLTE